MGALFSYSLTASVFLLFGYLAYKLFLSSEKQPVVNRAALILIYVVSGVAVPLLSIRWMGSETADGEIAGGTIELGQIVVNVATADPARPEILPRLLLTAYLAGVVLTLLFTLYGLLRLAAIVVKGRKERIGEYLLVTLPRCEVPFSFGKYIVVGSDENRKDLEMIVAHEGAHLRCRHWIDLVIAQAACIVEWYNPAAWLMRQELRQLHEYQADAGVLANGYDPYEYQMLLIKKAAGRRLQSLANSLNHSNLSKRITMMYKSENRAVRALRSLTLLPAIVLAALAVQQPAVATSINSVRSATLAGGEESVAPARDKVNQNFSVDQQDVTAEAGLPDAAVEEVAVETVAETPVAVKEPAPEAEQEEVAKSVAKMPQFPGGDKALMLYIMDNLRYPADAMEAGEEGRVVVKFVVGKDGEVRDPEIMRSCGKSLDAEAIRVISSLPAFEPGRNEKGEAVACGYALPVTFKLKKDKKEKEVTRVTGNITIHDSGNETQMAYFVNGEPFEGNLSEIDQSRISEIIIIKNDPAYPHGKMNITLRES